MSLVKVESQGQNNQNGGQAIAPAQSTSKKSRKAQALARQEAKKQEALVLAQEQEYKAMELAEQSKTDRQDFNEALVVDLKSIKEVREDAAQVEVTTDELIEDRAAAEIQQFVAVELGVAEKVAKFKAQFRSVMAEADRPVYVETKMSKTEQFDFFANL